MAITAIILAGGQGNRMGGKDKGWIPYRGLPLIQHVIQRLTPQVDAIIISCNRNRSRYLELGYPVVSDYAPDYSGPLAGIAAATTLCETSHVLLSPCDTPALPTDLVSRLALALNQSEHDGAIPHDGERPQYLSSLLQRPHLATAQAALDAGRPAVKTWLADLRTTTVDFADCAVAFHNVNRPDDLKA